MEYGFKYMSFTQEEHQCDVLLQVLDEFNVKRNADMTARQSADRLPSNRNDFGMPAVTIVQCLPNAPFCLKHSAQIRICSFDPPELLL